MQREFDPRSHSEIIPFEEEIAHLHCTALVLTDSVRKRLICYTAPA
jgi:hypothetical protein